MATIRTRKRGKTYSYNFDAGLNKNGKRKIVEKGGFASKQEAYDAGVKALAAYKNGNIAIVSEKVSTADFLDSWLAMKAGEVRPNTVKSYATSIIRIKKYIGNVAINKLRPRDVDSFLRDMAKDGKSYMTVKNTLNVIRGALDYAVYPCELIQANPAHYVKLPKKLPRNIVKRQVITTEQFSALLKENPYGSDNYMPIMLAYHTGMRLGEVLGLCWDEVDLSKGIIAITRQLVYTPATGNILGEPKTESGKRKILIDRQLVVLPKKWKATQAKNELAKGKTYIYCYEGENGGLWQIPKGQDVPKKLTLRPLVCTMSNGGLISHFRVIRGMKKAGLNFHSLRHTHATILAENHAIAKDVAARLGHSDASLTQNLYTHDTEEMQKDTLAIFEQTLAKNAKV